MCVEGVLCRMPSFCVKELSLWYILFYIKGLKAILFSVCG